MAIVLKDGKHIFLQLHAILLGMKSNWSLTHLKHHKISQTYSESFEPNLNTLRLTLSIRVTSLHMLILEDGYVN